MDDLDPLAGMFSCICYMCLMMVRPYSYNIFIYIYIYIMCLLDSVGHMNIML